MNEIDRLAIRRRPSGSPAMLQRWNKLLFLHWRIHPALLRPLVPEGLAIDTYDGAAWVGVTPFTIHGIRPPLLPALPLLSRSHEINVRTYVVHRGIPGVWFFSLDASNPLAVVAARATFRLPYFHARMRLDAEDETVRYSSRRSGGSEPRPEFVGGWRIGSLQPSAPVDSLTFFLTERYVLYTRHRDRIFRSRIHHRPWPLHDATVDLTRMTMLSGQGIPHDDHPPLLHAQGSPLDVEIWPLERVNG